MPPFSGIEARTERGHATVTQVHTGSPAAVAGVYAGDEIVAVDGWRADEKAWRQRLAERGAGETVTLALFRRDRLVEVSLALATPSDDTAWLEALPDAPAVAKVILDSWAPAK